MIFITYVRLRFAGWSGFLLERFGVVSLQITEHHKLLNNTETVSHYLPSINTQLDVKSPRINLLVKNFGIF